MSCSTLTSIGLLDGDSGAVISECGRYRYWLHRRWSEGRGWVVFALLNPSTADATQDDPTIRRCVGFAKRFGAEGLIVVNLFAARATHPNDLLDFVGDPVGPENHQYVVKACEMAAQHELNEKWRMNIPGKVICGWGAHWLAAPQVDTMMGWIEVSYGRPYCLGFTRSGAPRHPLYVRADEPLQHYDGGR